MKAISCLLAALILICGLTLESVPALADGFSGFDVIIIDGSDDQETQSAGDGLVLTLGGVRVLDSWEGESDPHFAYVAVEANLMNWTEGSVTIADSVTASLVYQNDYAYEGRPVFSLEKLGMLERLDGQLVFRVPLLVAQAGPGEAELLATVQGEELFKALDLAAAGPRRAEKLPFDFDDRQGTALEASPADAIVRGSWNGRHEEVARWLVQKLHIINWSRDTATLNADALSGSLVYMDKYAFQGSIEYDQAAIEPLEIIDAALIVRIPTVTTEARDDENELWLKSEGFEYREILDMASAQNAGASKEAELDAKYSAGSIITFGHYEQDNNGNNGSEGIEWVVLDQSGGSALLLSRYALDVQMYSTDNSEKTWKTSNLRSWMTESFQPAAFTDEELDMIWPVTLDNSSSQGLYETDGGAETVDKVFALSYAQVMEYLPEASDRLRAPTSYARARGAHSRNGYAIWLTRSPGQSLTTVIRVNEDGSVTPWNNKNEGYNNICVCPAVMLDLFAYDEANG